MATSSSRNFALTRDNLIRRSFETINIYGPGESIRDDDNAYAVDLLNMLIKSWQIYDLFLWNKKQGHLFTDYQDEKYNLGTTGDNWTSAYVNTTLSAAEASGQTILSVTSSTGMTASDNVGIQLDDGTRQWTTIATVDSSTQITVDTALTGAAASGSTVITYTSKAERPLRILGMRYEDITSTSKAEVILEGIDYEDYFDLTAKESDAPPTVYMYDKQLTNGVLYLYPRPANVKLVLNISYYEVVEDLDAAGDDFDFPAEWQLPLMFNLATMLCYRYKKFEVLKAIQPEAQHQFEMLKLHNNTEVSLKFKPSSGSSGGSC